MAGYVNVDARMKKIIAGQTSVRDGMEQAARECDQIVAEAHAVAAMRITHIEYVKVFIPWQDSFREPMRGPARSLPIRPPRRRTPTSSSKCTPTTG